MIASNEELAIARERVARLERTLETLRGSARLEEWAELSAGYLLEIERAHKEILDYLARPLATSACASSNHDSELPAALDGLSQATRVDLSSTRNILESFGAGRWKRLSGADLHAPTTRNPDGRRWTTVSALRQVGGNYVFLFPELHFDEERQILLDGPAQRQIPFRFSRRNHVGHDGLFVAYVGKAADLHQRFQWHFSLASRNTGAQVQYGLVKSGICNDRKSAVSFMLKHAVVYYVEMSGDGEVANRDLLELSLCARFAPPFNIKSER